MTPADHLTTVLVRSQSGSPSIYHRISLNFVGEVGRFPEARSGRAFLCHRDQIALLLARTPSRWVYARGGTLQAEHAEQFVMGEEGDNHLAQRIRQSPASAPQMI